MCMLCKWSHCFGCFHPLRWRSNTHLFFFYKKGPEKLHLAALIIQYNDYNNTSHTRFKTNIIRVKNCKRGKENSVGHRWPRHRPTGRKGELEVRSPYNIFFLNLVHNLKHTLYIHITSPIHIGTVHWVVISEHNIHY